MKIELLRTYLIDKGFAQPVFCYAMPAECELGALLKLPLDGIPVDHELPNYYKGEFQAIVRAKTQAVGHALAWQVMTTLASPGYLALPVAGPVEMKFNYIRPRTLPIRFPRSDLGEAIEWSINFDCCFTMAT